MSNDSRTFAFFVGMIVVSIAIGTHHGPAVGFTVFGGLLMFMGAFGGKLFK